MVSTTFVVPKRLVVGVGVGDAAVEDMVAVVTEGAEMVVVAVGSVVVVRAGHDLHGGVVVETGVGEVVTGTVVVTAVVVSGAWEAEVVVWRRGDVVAVD